MKKQKTQLFSAVLDLEDSRRFEEIAKHRKKTKSAVLRDWIANSHKAIQPVKEAERA